MPAPPLFIVNPACGVRDRAQALSRTLFSAGQALGDLAVRETAGCGDARRLALEGARQGHPLIVAVGGDGTLSEVVDGVMTASETAHPASLPAEGGAPSVGLINMGTGGDFRRNLGLEAAPEHCIQALASGRERTIDVGLASFAGPDGQQVRRYFVNVLSAGLGGLVDHYIETAPPFLGGRAAYYLASLRAVLAGRERPLAARITWRGETREQVIPAYLVAICNGRWFGGGMDVAPMASPADGRLEVVTITERNRLFLAFKIRTIYSGRHLQERSVHHFPCQRLELSLADKEAERLYLLDVDGDPLGSLPLSVEVVPGALRVRA